MFIFEEGQLGMSPLQVAALKQFLVHNHFVYKDYNEEAGAVIYSFSVSDWTMEVAYGDECYYCLYNDVTEESFCEEFVNVSTIISVYNNLSWMQENFRFSAR